MAKAKSDEESNQDEQKQSTVYTRPSRKAKTKEAVLKHLNRDVELLTEEKLEKKPSVKKSSLQTSGINSAIQGKDSSSK